MSKYITPGIYYNEIDNTVRNDTTVGVGRGAIVFNSDRGYVNQRVLSNDYTDFTTQFGDPTTSANMGHFAAKEFFNNGSTQLLGVRATMGDERYSFIQYPLADSVNVSVEEKYDYNTEQLQFVDNDGNNQLKLLNVFTSAVVNSLSADLWEYVPENVNSAFYAQSEGTIANFTDLYDQNSTRRIIYRNSYATSTSGITSGTFYQIPTNKSLNQYNRFILKDSAEPSVITNDNTQSAYFTLSTNTTANSGTTNYVKITLNYDASNSLNDKDIQASYYINSAIVYNSATSAYLSALNTMDVLNSANILGVDSDNFKATANKMVVSDWDDDLTLKTYYVPTTDISNIEAFDTNKTAVSAVEYREYNHGDNAQSLYISAISSTLCSEMTATSGDKSLAKLEELADDYGLAVTDIGNANYGKLSYVDARTKETIDLLVYVDKDTFASENKYICNTNKYLFICYADIDKDQKTVGKSIYTHKEAAPVIVPWQISKDTSVDELIAQSTMEMFSDTTGIWADGYTPTKLADEPGNGDIETYNGKSGNLVIGALAPGDYLNRVGISIISPDAAEIPALNGGNCFTWKYSYDDEDKVDKASDNYLSNEENLTWKKVYRINVYVRGEDKDESVWGTGLTSLQQDPTESFLVSNDPKAKDAAGNSLYAPVVVNGTSNYIYISSNSVEQSINGTNDNKITQYAIPAQTYSIYSLTGGKNSQLNDVKQKTSAMKLYADSEKAHFDILFNVEPIESFTSKQKYKAMQDKIASIVIDRGKDIGFIQCSSREAKTANLIKSECKNFKYSNGSYVAGYAGYDKYYDSTISEWINMPKSIAGACCECYCQVYSYPWMSPAGTDRGIIRYSYGASPKLSNKEVGQIYELNVNTSQNYIGYGELFMTQKNFLKKDSALNRIDIRALLNYMENSLDILLLPYLHRKGSDITLSSIKTTVQGLLKSICAGEGIKTGYSVTVKKDTTDPRLVYCNIFFIPEESIEFIEVNLTINREGITYTENT